ncbi:UPF0149 family protein [Aliiglaciecola sp.]|nr:UPF0149 family protein [Aliiglaciecola sp.]
MAQISNDFRAQLVALCDDQFASVLHDSDFVSGVIFAVCAAPEIPMPDIWLSWAFNQHGQLASEEEANNIADALMIALQEQLREISAETFDYPMKSEALPKQPSKELPVSRWLKGLVFGHSQLEQLWESCWQQVASQQSDKLPKLQTNLKHCLMMFTTFANVPLALEQAKRVGNTKLVENIDTIFKSLPSALKTYVDIAGELAQFLPDQFETFVQPTSEH